MIAGGALREALVLSERILTDIEMSSVSLTSVALKASRLARIIGQFDQQQIMMYEASGYPKGHSGVPPDVWKYCELAGRIYEEKKDDEVKRYARLESIEQLEIEAAVAKDGVIAAVDANVSVASANPNQFISSPVGNAKERARMYNTVGLKTKLLAERRAYIHNFVCTVYYELRFSSVANDIFERTRTKVDKKIGDVIPEAIKKFSAVYDNLVSENNEDWSNAVHSCRRILQDTADGVYPAREDKVIEVGGKQRFIKLGADNYINRLIAYVEENSSSQRFEEIVGSHMKYLGERLDSIFQAAQKGSHDIIASQDEADRYVIYTYLVIGDILQLKDEIERSPAPQAV